MKPSCWIEGCPGPEWMITGSSGRQATGIPTGCGLDRGEDPDTLAHKCPFRPSPEAMADQRRRAQNRLRSELKKDGWI